MDRFDPQRYLGKRGFKYLTPATRYALAATSLACEDAGLEDGPYSPEEIGVCLGTHFAVHQVLDSMDEVILSEGAEGLQPMHAPNFTANLPASYISMKRKFLAFNLTLTNLFVAGLEAVLIGAQAIRRGRAHLVLTGGTEGRPPERVRALLGGSLAEGAACALVLERLSAARARAARVYASIGRGAFWFIPRSLVEGANSGPRAEAMLQKHLDQVLPEGGGELPVCAFDLDFPLNRLGRQCLLRELEGRGFEPHLFPVPGLLAAEGCVAPLLGLAAVAAVQGQGLIFAASPQGHVALLNLEPVEAAASGLSKSSTRAQVEFGA